MSIDTTTTTRTDTSVQKGVQLVVNEKRDTVQVGNFVTDVSIQPYIAPRVVAFYAYNMRPGQRLHAFFDSVNVDAFCSPGFVPASIANTSDYRSVEKNGQMGDPLKADVFGQVAGWFNIPEGTFKTGDRVFELCDADNIVLGTDAVTTIASATFTASNLSVTKNALTLTTVNPEISTIPVTNTLITTSTTESIVVNPEIGEVRGSWFEPVAQGLTINTPSGEAGIFATSIDVYFKQKAQIVQNGVTLYICETDNGYPNGSRILPFASVHKNWSEVVINDNGVASYTVTTSSTDNQQFPTNFKFEAPVFLNNGVEYAFVIRPDGGDPDYWVYTAELGDVDLLTNKQMFSQPVLGTAFYGATDKQWTALQSEYIKFKLNRAKFSSGPGEAYFVNSNTDFINVFNVAYDTLTDGIMPGDFIFQSTSGNPATADKNIYGIVDYYDEVKGLMYIANSSGNFVANKTVQVHRFSNSSVVMTPGPNTTTIVAYANTGNLHNVGLNSFVPQIASITPAGTSVGFKFSGVSNSYTSDTLEYPVNPGATSEFYDQERIVASKTNEVNYHGGVKSLSLHATLATDSEFVSPIIDTVRKQQLVIANDLDPIVFKYEEFFNSGDSKSKYVSKVITLANGQDAEDLQVILSAHRPVGTDIQVWVKFLNGEDSDLITNKTWCPMINESPGSYSSPGNPSDMKEFTFTVPKYYGMLPTNGSIVSTNTNPIIAGVNTKFLTDVKKGWYVNMLPNTTFNESTRKVISIASDEVLTLNSPFDGNYQNSPYFVVAPPTTPWLSSDTAIPLQGTVNTYTTNNAVIGSGTNFTGELAVGTILKINSDSQTIVSISNATYLSVGSPWSANNVANTAYRISPNGVSYLNESYSQYSSFKRFQIKIILQSENSSSVPLVNDVRALALQL